MIDLKLQLGKKKGYSSYFNKLNNPFRDFYKIIYL